MIFDSKEMRMLRERYSGLRDFELPRMLGIDKLDWFQKERVLLENIFSRLPEDKRGSLLSRLLSTDHGQHLSAWFELRFFDWLSQLGDASFEPEIEGEYPDACLLVGKALHIFEARVLPISANERQRDRTVHQIIHVLQKIRRPYLISVDGFSLDRIEDEKGLIESVERWLDKDPTEVFDYGNDKSGHLVLSATSFPELEDVRVFSTSGFQFANPDLLRKPLKKKASQHKNIRSKGYPYILAFYIEPTLLSAREVVQAWLGNHQYIVETTGDKTTIVDERFDLSGLNFYGDEIQHKSVSGTLVFKSKPTEHGHSLETWWVENPVANIKVNPAPFPTVANWIVIRSTERGVEMGWRDADG